MYCPAGSGLGVYCPDGTYSASPSNYSTPGECTACPPAVFCTNGRIQGPCNPGHMCLYGVAVPDPDYDFGVPPVIDAGGGLCPAGGYCDSGVSMEISCPNMTFRPTSGGEAPSDCGQCPLGYLCTPFDPIPTPCPAGNYCPNGNTIIPCPRGTFNSHTTGSDETHCAACLPGYECSVPGIYNITAYPCPPGAYCAGSTVAATPCPAGSLRAFGGAESVNACPPCPGGSRCPYAGMTTALTCPAKTYCPPGSVNATNCPAGYVCGDGTATPLPCPVSNYCAENTSLPILCPESTYCPGGASVPLACPRGFKSNENGSNANRGYFAAACEACPPGQYSDIEASPQCSPCLAGYVCLGETSHREPSDRVVDKGFVCEVGYYCPEGSSAEIACPAGTYNAIEGRSNLTDCFLCEAQHFQDQSAQASCKLCASSAFSPLGASTCTCSGLNRDYQISDGELERSLAFHCV